MKINKSETADVAFKNKTTGEVIFKTETQLTDFDVESLTNTSIDYQQGEDASTYTVHTTDDEGVTGVFNLVGVELNSEAVTIEIKNSKGITEKILIDKKSMTEEEFDVYRDIKKKLTNKE